MLKKVWTWSCNNKTFLDKITAVRESVREDKPVYYHAPQGYDQFAWFEESADSWEQTLKNRALQIRQSSKKINLLFSGGCDSTKMLHSFVTNNIFIDEITCLKHGILEADFEVTEVAEPYLKKIKHLIPKTKITIKNLTAKDYENYYNDPYWAEKQTWANHIRFRLTHPVMDNTLFLQSDTDTVHVLGRDKPHLVYHNSDWYTYFLDVDIETNQFMNNSNCVFFYADDPAIHAKQCHILKNYIEKNFDIEQYKNQLAISKIAKAKGLLWSAWKGLFKRNEQGKAGEFISNDLDQIAKVLLGDNRSAADLGSLESILATLPKDVQDKLMAELEQDRNWNVAPRTESLADKNHNRIVELLKAMR